MLGIKGDQTNLPQVYKVVLACAPAGRFASTAIKSHESKSSEWGRLEITVPGIMLYNMQGPHAA